MCSGPSFVYLGTYIYIHNLHTCRFYNYKSAAKTSEETHTRFYWSRSSSGAFGIQSRSTKSFAKFGKSIFAYWTMPEKNASVKWIGINNVITVPMRSKPKSRQNDDAAASGASQQIIKKWSIALCASIPFKTKLMNFITGNKSLFSLFSACFPFFFGKKDLLSLL